MKILVTGSSGLIGSEAVTFFDERGHEVFGADNNMRRVFFGEQGDTTWNLERLKSSTRNFKHADLDIRDRDAVFKLFEDEKFDAVIHCAAQPSHDKAAQIALLDFDVNAVGTVNLLEAARQSCPESPFIHVSTNKVYGDSPNELPMVELETRWDYADEEDYNGITEECRIDRTLHSLFGASKTAGDVMAQEYGRYFNMPVGIFRGGCLTGPSHSGVELHGFLSYLVKQIVTGGHYTIFGYKGKQVRDQIHSYDVIRAFEEFIKAPRAGEVYNLGGGRENSASLIECIEMVENMTGKKLDSSYSEQNRIGDHICYISDLTKLKTHYPNWEITRDLNRICEEIVEAEQSKAVGA
ncbi:MAG TPA: NAD-dependent epimerase/dehydratase family protein [Aridibacter sp.]|nr:NAD-dependent epimerase/dehydratase family protein [Aridibacter sp.]